MDNIAQTRKQTERKFDEISPREQRWVESLWTLYQRFTESPQKRKQVLAELDKAEATVQNQPDLAELFKGVKQAFLILETQTNEVKYEK